jgi:hypothetical protein
MAKYLSFMKISTAADFGVAAAGRPVGGEITWVKGRSRPNQATFFF